MKANPWALPAASATPVSRPSSCHTIEYCCFVDPRHLVLSDPPSALSARPAPIGLWRQTAEGPRAPPMRRLDKGEVRRPVEGARAPRLGSQRPHRGDEGKEEHERGREAPTTRGREEGHQAEAAGERAEDGPRPFQAYARPTSRPTRSRPDPRSATSAGNWMPDITAAGKVTMAASTDHPRTCPAKPTVPSWRSAMARSARRTPSAKGSARKTPSRAHVSAKPWTVAGLSSPNRE